MEIFVNGLFVPVHDGAEPYRGYLIAADGVVVDTGAGTPDIPAQATVVDLAGKLVVPGFVSAHSHLWQSVFRGIADGCSTYGWIAQLHQRFGARFTEADMYAFTMHGGRDLLRHGITTVCNHTHNFGSGAEGQWRAALDLPMRTVYAHSPTHSATAAERLAGIEWFQETTATVDDQRILARSYNTTWPMSAPEMRKESALLAEYGIGQHLHYLEDPTVIERQRAEFPLLLDTGRVTSDTVFAHFIHTTPEIVAEAGKRGAAMVWNPLSNGRLGSGIPDIAAYQAAGVRVGLGVDGQASADVADPFQNMRTGLYLLRGLAKNAGVLSSRDILRMHTLGSAEALGVASRVGSLEPGKFADFVVLDPDRPSTGPLADDVYAHTVLALSAANVVDVRVGGHSVSTGLFDTPDTGDAHERVARLRAAL
ncbi:8-oxoguanine deaminase [Nocardia camponoti]|uniref:8-oxoguanine deaminase n=1 Tax=Nocardia camponoti TaxID=1616106 RepID=A0A917QH21_9NOCA|nr:8-oxoguanine deaminase [Nocardia camponoti]